MWYLIVNRHLKSYRVYGPFDSMDDANEMGKRLAGSYNWVKAYTITQATKISFTVENGFRLEATI